MPSGDIDKIISEADHRMKKAIQVLRDEFLTVRTGRASTALVERVTVSYYGTQTPLNQLATISAPEPRMLTVQPYDKTVINEMEKAIMQSDLGITPSNDGNLIRLPIPPLTEERRKDLIKVVKHMAEESRVAIRNVRRDANEHLKALKKDKHMSEDEERRAEDEMQKKTDKYIEEIDHMLKQKETEIMEV
jgi:ribosome recycling factor